MSLFLPLLGSIPLVSRKIARYAPVILISTFVAIILLQISIMLNLGSDGNIVTHSYGELLSFMLGYSVDILSSFFVLSITAIFFLITVLRIILHKNSISEISTPFYGSLCMISIFSIVGLCFSANIFSIFIFAEIYSTISHSLLTNLRDRNSVLMSFRSFISGSVGTIIILFSFLFLAIATGSAEIDEIKNHIASDTDMAYLYGTIFIAACIGILYKFFSFAFLSESLRKNSRASSYMFVSIRFISAFVGIYIVSRLIFSVFGTDLIYDKLHLDIALVIIGISISLFNAIKMLKTHSTIVLCDNFCFINFGYIFIAIAASGLDFINPLLNISASRIASCFLFLLVETYILDVYETDRLQSLPLLKDRDRLVGYCFFIAFASGILLPFGGSFSGFINIMSFLLSSPWLIILSIGYLASKAIMIVKLFMLFKFYGGSLLDDDKNYVSSVPIRNKQGYILTATFIIIFGISYSVISTINSHISINNIATVAKTIQMKTAKQISAKEIQNQ